MLKRKTARRRWRGGAASAAAKRRHVALCRLRKLGMAAASSARNAAASHRAVGMRVALRRRAYLKRRAAASNRAKIGRHGEARGANIVRPAARLPWLDIWAWQARETGVAAAASAAYIRRLARRIAARRTIRNGDVNIGVAALGRAIRRHAGGVSAARRSKRRNRGRPYGGLYGAHRIGVRKIACCIVASYGAWRSISKTHGEAAASSTGLGDGDENGGVSGIIATSRQRVKQRLAKHR